MNSATREERKPKRGTLGKSLAQLSKSIHGKNSNMAVNEEKMMLEVK
jgi:hypothetical protein